MLNKIRLIRFGCNSAAVFVLDVSHVHNWTPTRFGARQMCKPIIVGIVAWYYAIQLMSSCNSLSEIYSCLIFFKDAF